MTKHIFFIFVLCLLLKSGPGIAGYSHDKGYYPVSVTFENDIVAKKDQGYTNGFVMSISSPWYHPFEDSSLNTLFDLASPFSLIKKNIQRQRINFAFGQSMFTPKDLRQSDLIKDDQPYAGLLFGRVSMDNENNVTADSIALVFGIVGPDSMAGETQSFAHHLAQSDEPKGWHNQLKDEPVLNLSYRFKWKPYSAFVGSTGMKAEMITYTGASLGNLITGAEIGVLFRFGKEINSFGSPASFGGIQALPDMGDSPCHFTWFFFSGIEGAYLTRLLFLDGNTFKKSHHVGRTPENASFYTGLIMERGRYRIGFYLVQGTRSFDSQTEKNKYGSITFGYLF